MSFEMDAIQIASFLIYFAPGYVFISIFYRLNNYQRENNREHLFVKCVAVSYLVVALCDVAIPTFYSRELTVLLFSFVAGVIAGYMSQLKIVELFAGNFFKTMSKNVWLDIAKKARGYDFIVANFKLKNNTLYYRGQISFIEAFEREPIIGIRYYICFDKDNNSIQGNDDNELIVKFSDIEKFEIEYIKADKPKNDAEAPS
jgi:hypothetical protein